jgi:methylglutaconyl-CoA hydratase
MFDTITLDTDTRGVASVTLNRPGKHNAMSARMMDELHAAATHLAEDASVRVVVLRAAGNTFCAGGDLGWMREQMTMDRAQRMREARRLADMFGALNTLPKPLIGAIAGNAFGGGVGLVCVCDASVAVDTAKFGLTETRLGLIPATIGPYVLARLGEGAARRVFMSARVFDAKEAADLGGISRCVAVEDFETGVAAEVSPYLACAPGAVAAAKALVRRLGPAITKLEVDDSIEALANQWQSAEAEEGIDAFFAKRAPAWARGE